MDGFDCLANSGAPGTAPGPACWDWIVEVTVFHTDLDFAPMNRPYAEAFAANKPTPTTVEVSRLPTSSAIVLKVIAAQQ